MSAAEAPQTTGEDQAVDRPRADDGPKMTSESQAAGQARRAEKPQRTGRPQAVRGPQATVGSQAVARPQAGDGLRTVGEPQRTGRPRAVGDPQAAGERQAAGQPQALGHPHSPGQPQPTAVPHVLDNPARAALTGPHAHFAERHGRILRYPVDVTPWLALPDEPDADDWADLAAFAGPGAEVPLLGFRGPVPEDWEVTFRIEGVQFVDDGLSTAPEPEAVRLGPDDVPEMLDLVARTQPGPFLPRTIELGTYLGIRREGALVAMAGERLHPPGWTEISAVCTDPAFRGEGLATRLILAVAHGIRERGETPFLHTGAGNTNAIRLYESLGFRLRRTTAFMAARAPERLPEGRTAVPVA